MRRDQIPDEFSFKKEYLPDAMEWINPGGSAIVDPDGKWVLEPVFEREEILYAQIDPEKMRGPRFQLDVAGHYSRPDIFQLAVNRQRQPMIQEREDIDQQSKETEK